MFPEDVVRGVKAGDPDAVGAVYVRLADRLLGYLMARVRDRAAAEDLLEATFIELLQKGSTITGGAAAIKVWLFRAAHFNALDHIRKRQRLREELQGDVRDVDVEDVGRGPAELAEADELRRAVHGALGRLREDQRQVLLLRYLAELSAQEVADVMGKTVGAVRSLQHRGERSLSRLLRSRRPIASSGPAPTSKDRER